MYNLFGYAGLDTEMLIVFGGINGGPYRNRSVLVNCCVCMTHVYNFNDTNYYNSASNRENDVTIRVMKISLYTHTQACTDITRTIQPLVKANQSVSAIYVINVCIEPPVQSKSSDFTTIGHR